MTLDVLRKTTLLGAMMPEVDKPKALLPPAMPQEVDAEKSKEAERRRASRLQANQTLMTADWLQPPTLMKQRLG